MKYRNHFKEVIDLLEKRNFPLEPGENEEWINTLLRESAHGYDTDESRIRYQYFIQNQIEKLKSEILCKLFDAIKNLEKVVVSKKVTFETSVDATGFEERGYEKGYREGQDDLREKLYSEGAYELGKKNALKVFQKEVEWIEKHRAFSTRFDDVVSFVKGDKLVSK